VIGKESIANQIIFINFFGIILRIYIYIYLFIYLFIKTKRVQPLNQSLIG